MHPLHHKAKSMAVAKVQSVAGTAKNHEAPDDKANRLAMQGDTNTMPPQPEPDADDMPMGG